MSKYANVSILSAVNLYMSGIVASIRMATFVFKGKVCPSVCLAVY